MYPITHTSSFLAVCLYKKKVIKIPRGKSQTQYLIGFHSPIGIYFHKILSYPFQNSSRSLSKIIQNPHYIYHYQLHYTELKSIKCFLDLQQQKKVKSRAITRLILNGSTGSCVCSHCVQHSQGGMWINIHNFSTFSCLCSWLSFYASTAGKNQCKFEGI